MNPPPAPPPSTGAAERKAGWVLLAIAVTEGSWVAANWIPNGFGFLRYLGFGARVPATVAGWAGGAVVAALFVGGSLRLPSVRQNLVRPSGLKLLAVAVAVAAGILEEVMFRKWIMDAVLARGWGGPLQVFASAAGFGLMHGVWGLLGRSWRAAVGATLATGALGGALGIVYLLAGRNLAPCVAAHFVINVFLEPGLLLAAARGEFARGRG